MCLHQHQPIEARLDGERRLDALVPKLQFATVARLPRRVEIVEQVDTPVVCSQPVMTIVDMRVQEVSLSHDRHATRIRGRVWDQLGNAGQMLDGGDEFAGLQRRRDVRQEGREQVEAIARLLTFSEAVQARERLAAALEGLSCSEC